MRVPIKNGDSVMVISETFGWAGVEKGEIGIVTEGPGFGSTILVDFKDYTAWRGSITDFVKLEKNHKSLLEEVP